MKAKGDFNCVMKITEASNSPLDCFSIYYCFGILRTRTWLYRSVSVFIKTEQGKTNKVRYNQSGSKICLCGKRAPKKTLTFNELCNCWMHYCCCNMSAQSKHIANTK